MKTVGLVNVFTVFTLISSAKGNSNTQQIVMFRKAERFVSHQFVGMAYIFGNSNSNTINTTTTTPTPYNCYSAFDIVKEKCVEFTNDFPCEEDDYYDTKEQCEQNIHIQNTLRQNRLPFEPL